MAYDFTKSTYVARNDLVAWHPADTATSGSEIKDASGNSKDLACASSAPVLQTNVRNGRSAIYFDGTNNPLKYTHSGVFGAKHIFIVAKFDGATFTTFEGLLSDIASNSLLIGNNTGSVIFFNQGYGSNYSYRKNDVGFAESSQSAPINAFAIIELASSTGWSLDGIQIGQDRTFTGRKWKGWFLESLIYSSIQNEFVRTRLYQYFAMKWQIWQVNSNGLNIFPFPSNKVRSLERNREAYLSEPYSGDPKALVRNNFKRAFEAPFAVREESEFVAAETFHEQHFPVTKFIFRDWHFYPAKDFTCRFTSSIREQGSDVSNRFNYSFNVIETD